MHVWSIPAGGLHQCSVTVKPGGTVCWQWQVTDLSADVGFGIQLGGDGPRPAPQAWCGAQRGCCPPPEAATDGSLSDGAFESGRLYYPSQTVLCGHWSSNQSEPVDLTLVWDNRHSRLRR